MIRTVIRFCFECENVSQNTEKYVIGKSVKSLPRTVVDRDENDEDVLAPNNLEGQKNNITGTFYRFLSELKQA